MRIGLIHEGTLYPLAGEDGVSESVHSSAGDVTIEGNHPTQRVNRVRAANAVFYDRLNLATTVRFTTTRTFSTVAAAELWSLDYDAAMPRTGALMMESTTGTRYLQDAVVSSPSRQVYGCSVAMSYTVQGGGIVAETGLTEWAFLGDSLTETAFEWKYETFLGTSVNAVFHSARYEVDDLTDISVAHVNAGASQTLGVTITGSAVVVNLATDGAGVVTSTVVQVRDFCNAHAGYLALGLYARTLGTTDLAQAGSAKYLVPATASSADGYAAWLQLLSNGRIEPIRFSPTTYANLLAGSWTFGKSGLTTASIITYLLPDVLLLAAGKGVVEMSGANDVLLGVAEATTVANRCTMWDAMLGAGMTVVACEVMPMIESAPLVAAGDNADIVALNAALKAEAATRGIRWIEWPATMFDGTEAEATLWEVDGIHDNPAGCHIAASHVLSEIDDLITIREFEFPVADSDLWISANPYMTGGTNIATGWSNPTAYASATVTPSLVTIGGRQWQRLTVTQSGAEFKLAAFNLTGQAVTAGSRIRIAARMAVSSGFKNVRVKVIFNGPGGEVAAMEAIDDGVNMTSADYTITLPAHSGVWLSPPELVPTGATSATLTVWSFGAGTVDIAICGIIQL